MRLATKCLNVLVVSASAALMAASSCSAQAVPQAHTAGLQTYEQVPPPAVEPTTTTSTTEAPVVTTTEVPRVAPKPSYVAPAPRPQTAAAGASETLSVTNYCQSGTMADGQRTHSGAAAGNRWPFGTRINVPGWGIVTVEDRIGSGSDLDLYTPSCGQAIQWGRRELTVQILG